jgi:citrate lyase beta subunit
MCVVPTQTVIANEVFSPSAAEIERSRRLIEASGAAQSAGRGAIEFEGGMVDEPLIRRAQAIVRLANDLVSRNRDT